MSETHSFIADAAIIDRLGRELVSKQETALVELVKNAFDADATKVDVVFLTEQTVPVLEIRDDGSGMTKKVLLDEFLRLANEAKAHNPRSPRFQRRRAGRKGIGRLAAQRLGERLVLTTSSNPGRPGWRLTVDWREFKAGTPLDQVTVSLDRVSSHQRGTTVRIESLRDDWSESQIRRCWRGVLALQPPFPVAKVEGRPETDPGFRVKFFRQDHVYEDPEVVADLRSEVLNHLHAIIEMRVDSKGYASWRLTKNVYGDKRKWTRIHHDQKEKHTAPAYLDLFNVRMRAYYVILDRTELPSIVYTRVRDVLADQGGIRLYRNGFRVVPYGDPDDDWLRLDEMYSKRNYLIPIGNRNFFGVVDVEDEKGAFFEEHTSREGLIETAAFADLRKLVSSVLITAAAAIGEDRGRKTRTTSERTTPDDAESTFDDARSALSAVRRAVESAARSTRDPVAKEAAKRAAEAERQFFRETRALARREIERADEMAMLRLLATLGMTTAEFSHETGMTFDAFRLDFGSIFQVAEKAKRGDSKFLNRLRRSQAMLARLDTLTSYINSLAGARVSREMRPVSLKKAVRDFKNGIGLHADSENIELTVRSPSYDALFTRTMHEAEISSVLLNFYSNSVKALKRAKQRRRILVVASRGKDADDCVRIRFADTGDGIPEKDRERIFDAFFTTRPAPPASASELDHAKGIGLGLWIVRQIATNAGGKVVVIDPPKGYSACFEISFPSEEAGDG